MPLLDTLLILITLSIVPVWLMVKVLLLPATSTQMLEPVAPVERWLISNVLVSPATFIVCECLSPIASIRKRLLLPVTSTALFKSAPVPRNCRSLLLPVNFQLMSAALHPVRAVPPVLAVPYPQAASTLLLSPICWIVILTPLLEPVVSLTASRLMSLLTPIWRVTIFWY